MTFKPYRVDFKYMVEDQASFYVIAETPEAAKTGAEALLAETYTNLASPEVVRVEEAKAKMSEEAEASEGKTSNPTLN